MHTSDKYSKGTSSALTKLLMFQLAFLLGVILFGAVVRVTGSGAGCGNNWPLCHGEFVPLAPSMQTLIEYGHRISSGLTLPLAIFIFFWSKRIFSWRHKCTTYSFLVIILLILEALLGAGLVYFEHVANNASVYRGFSVGFHLVNTFMLTAVATSAWYYSTSTREFKSSQKFAYATKLLTICAASLLITGVSGVITALGDTLFPPTYSGEVISLAIKTSSHLFVQLRIFHPFVAITVSLLLISSYLYVAIKEPKLQTMATWACIALIIQVILGFMNIYLLAPIWMQIVHLFFAQIIWILTILIRINLVYEPLQVVPDKLNN